MARKARVKKNYPTKKPQELAPFANNVGEMMLNNESFSNPTVDPKALISSAAILSSDYSNRKNGVVAKEALKASLSNVVNLLSAQADYVSGVADGDVAVIASAGFDATKTTNSKAVVPQTPKPPVLANENGELTMKTQAVKGASSYCWIVFIGNAFPVTITNSQLNLNMQSNVIVVPAGTIRECIRGLVRSTEVTVQVLAQNSAGKSALSHAVSIGIA